MTKILRYQSARVDNKLPDVKRTPSRRLVGSTNHRYNIKLCGIANRPVQSEDAKMYTNNNQPTNTPSLSSKYVFIDGKLEF